MPDPTPFNWLNSTKPQRRKLYDAYRSVYKDGRAMDAAVADALGRKVIGSSYVDNFSQTRNAIADYADLFNHLLKQHPAVAHNLMRTLEPGLLSAWTTYYLKHRIDDRLAVALYEDRASPLFREPPGIERLYKEDTFYLQLDSDIEGHGIGFWRSRDYWFRLLLGPTPVRIGRQWVTRDDITDHPVANVIFGGPTGTGEIRSISYKGQDRFPDLVVIVADLPTVEELNGRGGNFDLPIKERTLDMFPAILETSKSPWTISWVQPSFVPQDAWYERSE